MIADEVVNKIQVQAGTIRTDRVFITLPKLLCGLNRLLHRICASVSLWLNLLSIIEPQSHREHREEQVSYGRTVKGFSLCCVPFTTRTFQSPCFALSGSSSTGAPLPQFTTLRSVISVSSVLSSLKLSC